MGRDVPERHLVEQVARGGEAAGGSVEQHERVGGMGRRRSCVWSRARWGGSCGGGGGEAGGGVVGADEVGEEGEERGEGDGRDGREKRESVGAGGGGSQTAGSGRCSQFSFFGMIRSMGGVADGSGNFVFFSRGGVRVRQSKLLSAHERMIS